MEGVRLARRQSSLRRDRRSGSTPANLAGNSGYDAVLRLQRLAGNSAVTAAVTKVQRQAAVAENVAAAGVHPPAKNSPATPQGAAALEEWMTAHVAGHALSVDPWTFYEVIDSYLGPWGQSGYPIGYGKKYAMLFSTNRTLLADPVGAEWVRRTCILLQEELITFLLQRYRNGTLGRLTESELRQAAFDSHPRAYTAGGLGLVASVAPELLPVIASIPRAEFLPSSPDFRSSVGQAADTAAMVLPEILGNYLAAAAGPAHTGGLARAADRDRRNFLAMIQLTQYLGSLTDKIRAGEVNNLVALERITRQLYRSQFPDQGYARVARDVITLANERKIALANSYAAAAQRNPSLAETYDRLQPGWRRWVR